jgi:SAM-dependent methyltransferase
LADYLEQNRRVWTKANEEYTDARAREAWAADEITWGMFGPSDSELGVLGDVSGKDVIELGCGTAYFCAWLARRGARVTGIDLTPAQLDTARRMSEETGVSIELIEANAEEVPLPDESFDLAISEYGASIWCDPYKWIPEAARLLRPGAELVFLCNAPLAVICSPDTPDGKVGERLERPLFGLHRMDWEGEDEGVDFHLPHGEMLRLLRETGFEIEGLWEIQASEKAEDHSYYDFVPVEWARKWPAEEIWKARKRG